MNYAVDALQHKFIQSCESSIPIKGTLVMPIKVTKTEPMVERVDPENRNKIETGKKTDHKIGPPKIQKLLKF